jgi:hypothetical protein
MLPSLGRQVHRCVSSARLTRTLALIRWRLPTLEARQSAIRRCSPFSLHSNAARLINLSVLTPILSGQPLTAGFVLSGSESKRVLIRAIGPTLSTFGVVNPVSDPTLLLYDSRGVIIGSNDDWQSSNASTMASAGAFALPAGSRDAVIVVTLAPGAYTAAARGFGNASGMVLIEVYEAP